MKLYINQRVFSIGDKYDVYNENDEAVLQVESEIFTIGARIHILDASGNEIYYIKQKLKLFLAEYEIYSGDNLLANVIQEFSCFNKNISIESVYGSYRIEGDLFGMDFDIIKDGRLFGSVSKKWLSFGDSYELYIPDEADYAFFAALVIAIDNCIHNENRG